MVRTEGDDHHPVKFRTWGPKVLARIGKFAMTIEDRSIVIQLKRKMPKEMRESMNPEVQGLALAPLKAKIMRWSEDNFEPLKFVQPELLQGLNDRAMDNWRPLFAVAERVGGEWPERARAAARASAKIFDEGDNNDKAQVAAAPR